jgi:hypothetical protein
MKTTPYNYKSQFSTRCADINVRTYEKPKKAKEHPLPKNSPYIYYSHINEMAENKFKIMILKEYQQYQRAHRQFNKMRYEQESSKDS